MAITPSEYQGLIDYSASVGVPKTAGFGQGRHYLMRVDKTVPDSEIKDLQTMKYPESEVQRLYYDDKTDLLAVRRTPRERSFYREFPYRDPLDDQTSSSKELAEQTLAERKAFYDKSKNEPLPDDIKKFFDRLNEDADE